MKAKQSTPPFFALYIKQSLITHIKTKAIMFPNSKPPGFSTEGYHVARCFSIVQLGTIFIVDKWQNQVRFTWEMPKDMREYRKGFGPSPKQMSKEYAASLYGKSNLKKHLITWLGEATVNLLDKHFDPFIILGTPCMIKIQHKQSNANAWFEDITDIQPCSEKDCPPQFNELRLLTLDSKFDKELFDKLPDFVAQKIMRSKEYQTLGFSNPNSF